MLRLGGWNIYERGEDEWLKIGIENNTCHCCGRFLCPADIFKHDLMSDSLFRSIIGIVSIVQLIVVELIVL